MGAYFINCVNKGLSIIPREFSDRFNLIEVRENCSDQGDTVVRGESAADQLFPGWIPTGSKKTSS